MLTLFVCFHKWRARQTGDSLPETDFDDRPGPDDLVPISNQAWSPSVSRQRPGPARWLDRMTSKRAGG
jgi:hypothetical protein